MTELEHYDRLREIAAEIRTDTGINVTVHVAEYWSGGKQQTDFYSIRSPGRTSGPHTYQSARDTLYGFLRGVTA